MSNDEIEPAPYTEREQQDFDRLVQRYLPILKSKERAELAAGAAVALQRELEEEAMCP